MESLLKPKLMLFMSVDVINSTSFKNKQSSSQNSLQSVHPWLCFFTDFHSEFPQLFDKSVKEASPALPLPTFWKSAGDELLFYVQLQHYTDPLWYVTAFKETVNHYVDSIRAKYDILSLKASAWLAGFPVMNAPLKLVDAQGKTFLDYIGPNIDLGFRLRPLASRRKFVLSADLALMLAEDMTRNKPSRRVDICFDGRADLKGVMVPDGYPVFWVDMFDKDNQQEQTSLQILEDELLKHDCHTNLCTPGKVKEYCEKYFETQKGKLIIPFIDGDAVFGKRPPDYDSALEEVSILYREAYADDRQQNESAEATDFSDFEQLVTTSITGK